MAASYSRMTTGANGTVARTVQSSGGGFRGADGWLTGFTDGDVTSYGSPNYVGPAVVPDRVPPVPDPVKPTPAPAPVAVRHPNSRFSNFALPGRVAPNVHTGSASSPTVRATEKTAPPKEKDRLVCKPRPKDNRPKGGRGSGKAFVPWCD